MLTRTATMESDSSSAPTESSRLFSNLKESHAMTVIEIRLHRWGWKVFEARGIEPVFPENDQAIRYAQNRAWFRSGEIHVFDSAGDLERTIPFSEGEERRRKISFDTRLLNDTLTVALSPLGDSSQATFTLFPHRETASN